MECQTYSRLVPFDLRVVESPEILAAEGAKYFAELAKNAIRQTKSFTVALSGGTTPIGLFDCLARDYCDLLDWSNIHIFWVDERPVPPTDFASNYRSTKIHLLDKVSPPAANIHRIYSERPPQIAAETYDSELREFFAVGPEVQPCFDLIILGVGEDGHTASLFSETDALYDSGDLAVCNYIPKLAETRITITFPVINNATSILVLVCGAKKKNIVREVLKGPLRKALYPVQNVCPRNGKLIWLIDRAAGSEL